MRTGTRFLQVPLNNVIRRKTIWAIRTRSVRTYVADWLAGYVRSTYVARTDGRPVFAHIIWGDIRQFRLKPYVVKTLSQRTAP